MKDGFGFIVLKYFPPAFDCYLLDELVVSQIGPTIYYINVQSPNLDLKLGIKPKAGNFLSGKREGEGRERD